MDKPLHVRVAEALGLTCKLGSDPFAPFTVSPLLRESWMVEHQSIGADGPVLAYPVPRYDTDWSATGPLMERLGFMVLPENRGGEWLAATHDGHGFFGHDIQWADEANGPTPLIAVCNLILKLKEAGKLAA